MAHRGIIWVVFIAVLFQGCGGTKRMVGTGRAPKKGQITKEELRDELDRFEYLFVANMRQVADEINASDSTRRSKRDNLRMQSRIIEALHAMTASDDPIAGFLDTWAMVIRLRLYFEEGKGRVVHENDLETVLAFLNDTEAELDRIGKLFLKPQQFDEIQNNLRRFAKQHPVNGSYSNLVIYATHEKKEEAGVLLQTLSIPMAPIRALEGVDKTADAIHKVRGSVERFSDVAEQLPESTRWQMSILIDDFEDSEMTQSFQQSLESFSQSSAQLVEVMDNMPQQVRDELLIVLKESEQNQQQLQTTLQQAANAAAQVEKTLAQLDTTGQTLSITAEQAAEAADSWRSASDSIQELVQMFKGKPHDPNAPPDFGMRDFDAMLTNAGQSADKVAVAAAQIQQSVSPEAIQGLQKQLRSLVDHIIWRLFELTLAALLVIFGARYIINKRLKKN